MCHHKNNLFLYRMSILISVFYYEYNDSKYKIHFYGYKDSK